MSKRCEFCNALRDNRNFFWLEIFKENTDECWAWMELEDVNEENCIYIEVECCPNCQSEMM